MKVTRSRIPEVVEITPLRHGDDRGYFSETWRRDWFGANIADVDLVQDNQSLSAAPGTLRGLHFQSRPAAQGKLVRCVAGAIFDVAVDIRAGSPTYGKWVSAVLTSELGNQFWVPEGFLHGFCTLVPSTLVQYRVSNYYSPSNDRGVAWDDPEIGIAWPDVVDPALLSGKDKVQPRLRDLPETYFEYGVENPA